MAGDPGGTLPAGASPRLEGAALLDGLFPPFVRGVVGRVTDACDSPFAEERDAVAGAAPSRRREFLCGRACARAALEALGRSGEPIPVGQHREPTWPAGVVGSITHAGALAAAVVAHATDARGLGLDIELLEPPLDPRVQRLLLTPGEISDVQALGAIEPGAANILFSAKESVYKCVFPRVRRRLGPQEVAVALDLERRRFRAVVSEGSHGEEPALEGTFQLVAGYVLTGLCM